MKKRKLIILVFFILCGFMNITLAQDTGQMKINGELVNYMIDDSGDTLLIANLDDVSISSPRKFASREEYNRYRKYKYYAAKVYPYAIEGIKIFREVEYATNNMKKGEQKRYIRKLQKDLKREFEDPLKNLTKTQGKILVKMIEKELDQPMYDLIKNLRGGFVATYWNTLSGFYGHELKEGYTEGEDPILDAVLSDLDISYDVELLENR